MTVPPSAAPLASTERTQVRRVPERSLADRSELYALLDAGFVCHLGVIIEGTPRVLPTGYGRAGDTLFLHGSSGARSLRTALESEICVTVTHVDGIVLARSIFHHSLNYRSAVILGRATLVEDHDEKLAALRVLSESLAPGQWDAVRLPTRKELAKTSVIALPLAEASVKARGGPPSDDEEDLALEVWAGVMPVHTTFGPPVSDTPRIPVPDHIAARAGAALRITTPA